MKCVGGCGQLITGRTIHDEGEPWCEPCRHSLIQQRANNRARTATDAQVLVLVPLQRLAA